MRFIQSFSTSGTEQEAIDNNLLGKPYVAYIEDGKYIDWNTLSPTPPVPPEPVYSAMPLTFEIISGGTIGWVLDNVSGAQPKTIEYRINNGNWSSITSSPILKTFSVNSGDRVEFRGDNNTFGASNYSSYFVASGIRLNVEGNIMSLLNSTDYQNITAMTSANTYAFKKLFQNIGIVSAENLILPEVLTANCYSNMFKGCTSLITSPELPSSSMRDYCYASMFEDCTSLTTAPELPARTIGNYSYFAMFRGCTSLTTAPALPAITLAQGCYESMFYGCSSLKTAPELPATTRRDNCYREMFYGSGVNYVKCLLSSPGTASNTDCTNWLMFASDTGTFVKKSSASWIRGYSGIPNKWTVQDADI